jgi:hypothetical protein
MGGGPKEPIGTPTFWMRPRENPWDVAQGPCLMGVNPTLDQRMSHMNFYNSKKKKLIFFFFFFEMWV